MRSVYSRILLWSFGTLVLSLVAFFILAPMIAYRSSGGGGRARGLMLQLEEAIDSYQRGGGPALKAYFERVNRYLPGTRYLVDASGRDLITGDDRTAELEQMPGSPWWGRTHERLLRSTPDQRYRLIVISKPPVDPWTFVPFYLLVLLAVAFVSWLLAVSIASPLRQLTAVVERFGRGDLSVRVNSKRRDEIGDLARVFDQMAERMETLLTAERRLLQDISHELRSPLARLSFAAELAKNQSNGTAVERIRREVDRLASLVNSLVEMTRAEGDPSARVLEEVALDDLLEEVVGDCRVEAEAKGCSIQTAAVPSTLVRGERELLRRALENILRNAIRYSPAGMPLAVSLESGKGEAVVAVRDHGPGVPEESIEKVFEPFYRVDDSRESSSGGVGLGLAIARRAVHLHHGTVTAENAGPGLRVLLRLPLAA